MWASAFRKNHFLLYYNTCTYIITRREIIVLMTWIKCITTNEGCLSLSIYMYMYMCIYVYVSHYFSFSPSLHTPHPPQHTSFVPQPSPTSTTVFRLCLSLDRCYLLQHTYIHVYTYICSRFSCVECS